MKATGSLAALLLGLGCGSPPLAPPPAPPPPEAEPPAPAEVVEAPPAAEPDPPVHDCGQDPAQESPIVRRRLGDGERVVRIINNSGTEVQARLVREDLSAAAPGTLHIPGGETGEFYVSAGTYMVRYRHGGTCEVRRGALLVLTGPRAGVEIALEPKFERGNKSNMKKVTEPL